MGIRRILATTVLALGLMGTGIGLNRRYNQEFNHIGNVTKNYAQEVAIDTKEYFSDIGEATRNYGNKVSQETVIARENLNKNGELERLVQDCNFAKEKTKELATRYKNQVVARSKYVAETSKDATKESQEVLTDVANVFVYTGTNLEITIEDNIPVIRELNEYIRETLKGITPEEYEQRKEEFFKEYEAKYEQVKEKYSKMVGEVFGGTEK